MRNALLVSILGALSACEATHSGKGCFVVPAEQTTCPPADSLNLDDLFSGDASHCGEEVVALKGEGRREQAGQALVEACCYPAEVTDGDSNCVIGRPYWDGGVQRQAPLLSSAAVATAVDAERAAAWALAGAGEHASVAAFARLSLELMSFGAPISLLRDVHQAALEEVEHAKLCWELARLFGGAEVTPGRFPFQTPPNANIGLAELAAAAVRDGCLAETMGAHVVSIAAQHAPEPAVRAALLSIAEEEARHAVLSFRIVAWALRVDRANVIASVQAALATPWPSVDVRELSLRSNVDVACLAAAAQQAIDEIVIPATTHLLAA
jgi:hypothetical protein